MKESIGNECFVMTWKRMLWGPTDHMQKYGLGIVVTLSCVFLEFKHQHWGGCLMLYLLHCLCVVVLHRQLYRVQWLLYLLVKE